jgi:hypothetical protein
MNAADSVPPTGIAAFLLERTRGLRFATRRGLSHRNLWDPSQSSLNDRNQHPEDAVKPGRRLRFAPLLFALIAAAANAAGIRVDEPRDGEVVYDVNGKVFVNAELGEGELWSDLRFRLLMDGRPVSDVKYVPVFHLRDVPPGEHVVQAQTLDREGAVLATSDPVRFEMRTELEPE